MKFCSRRVIGTFTIAFFVVASFLAIAPKVDAAKKKVMKFSQIK